MALPTVGPSPRYIEEIRIGGGYGSSPDGGVDIDKAGNVAADGDVTIAGALALAATGVNKAWHAYVSAQEFSPDTAAGPANVTFQAGDVALPVLDFDSAVNESAYVSFALPANYDGSAIDFTVYWTASAGTTGDVRWGIVARAFDDTEALNQVSTTNNFNDTFLGISKLHVATQSITPDGLGAGSILSVFLIRAGSSGADTFDADARLIGMKINFT